MNGPQRMPHFAGDARRRFDRRRFVQGAAALGAAGVAGPVAATRRGFAQESVSLVYKTHEHAPSAELNRSLIAEFQQQHPEITIDYETLPYENYEQALLTSFAGGRGWDLFWAGDWMGPQFFENDILAPLDPVPYGLTTQDEFINLYDKGALDAYLKDGASYTGGISEYNTFSLLYNPDHFAEAGLPTPSADEPMTWETFAEQAATLAAPADGAERTRNAIGWFLNSPIWAVLIIEPLVRQLGGELVDPTSGDLLLTSEPVTKAMQYLADLGTTHKALDPAFQVDAIEDFAQGRSSSFIAGPWALAAIRGINPDARIGVAPLPVFDGGTRTTTLYSWAWFTGAQSSPEKQQAAWTFLSFLTAQGKRWWDATGYIQPRNALQDGVEDLAAYREEQEPLLKVFEGDFAYGRYQFRSTRYYEIANVLMRAQSSVLEGDDVASVMQEAQDELAG